MGQTACLPTQAAGHQSLLCCDPSTITLVAPRAAITDDGGEGTIGDSVIVPVDWAQLKLALTTASRDPEDMHTPKAVGQPESMYDAQPESSGFFTQDGDVEEYEYRWGQELASEEKDEEEEEEDSQSDESDEEGWAPPDEPDEPLAPPVAGARRDQAQVLPPAARPPASSCHSEAVGYPTATATVASRAAAIHRV